MLHRSTVYLLLSKATRLLQNCTFVFIFAGVLFLDLGAYVINQTQIRPGTVVSFVPVIASAGIHFAASFFINRSREPTLLQHTALHPLWFSQSLFTYTRAHTPTRTHTLYHIACVSLSKITNKKTEKNRNTNHKHTFHFTATCKQRIK